MARKGGCIKGCVVIPLIIILVLTVAVVAGTAILLNKTPAELGIADQDIMSGKTIRDIGLADVKLKDMVKFLQALISPDESTIVTNGYTAESQGNAESALSGSSINTGESIDYVKLLGDEPATYDKEYLVTYQDTTLAYILNTAINAAADDEDAELSDVKSMKASLMEISITKSGSQAKLRAVFALDMSGLKSQIAGELGAAGNILPLPDKVYIVSYYELSATTDGKLVLTSESIKINDSDSALSQAIFNILSDKVSEKTEEEASDAAINNLFGKVIVKLVWNLGKTGEANVDSSDNSVIGARTVGGGYGIYDHKLTLITHVAETEIE